MLRKLIGFTVLSLCAASAYSTSYTLNGNGSLSSFGFPYYVTEYDGDGELIGNTFSFNLHADVYSQVGEAEVWRTGVINVLTLVGEQTITACTGESLLCDKFESPGTTTDFSPTTLTLSPDGYLSWSHEYFVDVGNGQLDTSSSHYDASPVPVPAAAWLFGSALVGLVGFKRKK